MVRVLSASGSMNLAASCWSCGRRAGRGQNTGSALVLTEGNPLLGVGIVLLELVHDGLGLNQCLVLCVFRKNYQHTNFPPFSSF